MVQPVASEARRSLISGVWPIAAARSVLPARSRGRVGSSPSSCSRSSCDGRKCAARPGLGSPAESDPRAQLVDVRTDAEWNFVGVPDLVAAGKQAVLISWQAYPAMQHNAGFADQLKEAGFTARAPHLFHLPQRRAQPRRRQAAQAGRLPALLQRRGRVRGRGGCRRPPRQRQLAGRPRGCPGGNAKDPASIGTEAR